MRSGTYKQSLIGIFISNMKILSILNEFMATDVPPKKTFIRAYSISNGALDMIKKFEDFSSKAYKDTDGKMVIGYGTRIPDSSYLKKEISEAEAEKLLTNHLNKQVVPYIKTNVKRALNQNQWDALASLVYNIGGSRFAKSNLLKMINDGNLKGIRKEWLEWRLSQGKVLGGLEKRRTQEINHFFS